MILPITTARAVTTRARLVLACAGAIWRLLDMLILLPRPRLLLCYLRLWWLAMRDSPYRWPRSFESVLARAGSGQALGELVYGETPVLTLWRLLRAGGLRSGQRFCDLTAGRGRALLAAARLGARTRGVELLERHVRLASPCLAKAGIELVAGDGALADISEQHWIFLAWTGFDPPTRARFVTNLRSLAPDARVIALDPHIEDDSFELISEHRLPFSWGYEPVRIYRRRDSAPARQRRDSCLG